MRRFHFISVEPLSYRGQCHHDTVAQIMGHLQAHQYEGLVKKAKLRGKRR